jgi:hypothetical protein
MTESTSIPQADESTYASGFARDVSGENVHFQMGLAASVSAEQNLTMERAGAMLAHAGQDMQVSFGGASALVAGRDMKFEQGGGQVILAGNNIQFTNGGGQVLIAGNQATVNKGFVVAVISRQVNLGEGTRVMLNTPQAIAFGIVAGIVMAVLGPVFKRKGKTR